MNNLIAITIGDINGIGIEILINSLKNKKINDFVIFSNYNIFKKYISKKNIDIKINIVNKTKSQLHYIKDALNIYDFKVKNNVENTYLSIKFGYLECKKNNYIGLITLPIKKELIIKNINKKFIGHTEFLQDLDKKNSSHMILFHKKVIITPITTHISLDRINKVIKKNDFLYNKLISLNNTFKKDFFIKSPKFLISGINPHAGENGYIGSEEIRLIKPIIKKLKKKGLSIKGPSSADSMLIKKNLNKYDCFVFIYHDQALIPFKLISQFTGVNYTGNLDIIRTSPDHGTAYDLVGSNKVSNISLIKCFELIKKIRRNRIKYEKSKKITKSKFY